MQPVPSLAAISTGDEQKEKEREESSDLNVPATDKALTESERETQTETGLVDDSSQIQKRLNWAAVTQVSRTLPALNHYYCANSSSTYQEKCCLSQPRGHGWVSIKTWQPSLTYFHNKIIWYTLFHPLT